ncbi:hypothetical protein SADUNF_Sadunf17G0057700 [Salix dunnii]|uniref:TF-B3 domain-containing protein n=1 Tax=Salix dunnii TaxID=1413687 RepID=A0A835J5L8_9ROSI|nr:hypothetical protein SADUNF_Sadunf17G0057700 [Salix dunnii]
MMMQQGVVHEKPEACAWMAGGEGVAEEGDNKQTPNIEGGSDLVIDGSNHDHLDGSMAIDPRRLRFLFQKELKNSDVSSLRRMILPKKAAEAHLPVLESKEGIFIRMDDLDGLHFWSFKYRCKFPFPLNEMLAVLTYSNLKTSRFIIFWPDYGKFSIQIDDKIANMVVISTWKWYWPNNNSRMYVLENTGDFVNAHGLELGDFIMVYQDNQSQNYVIQAKKASDQNVYTDIARNAVNDFVVHDYEVSKFSSFCVNYPDADNTGLSFIYDTTTFSNDSPLDFLGGSMTNFSRIGNLESFGSVENLFLDDFY